MFGLSSLATYAVGGLMLVLAGIGVGAYGASVYYGSEINTMKAKAASDDAARATAVLNQFTATAT